MKLTTSTLRKLIREVLQEARLPAWERPGYVPEPGLGPEDPDLDEREVLVQGYGRMGIDQIKCRLVRDLAEMAEHAANGDFRRIGTSRLEIMRLFLKTLDENEALDSVDPFNAKDCYRNSEKQA